MKSLNDYVCVAVVLKAANIINNSTREVLHMTMLAKTSTVACQGPGFEFWLQLLRPTSYQRRLCKAAGEASDGLLFTTYAAILD